LVGESNDPRLAEIKAGAEKIVTEEGGVLEGIETMDRRKLAYKVEKDIRGMYVTRRFELPEREGDEEKNPIEEMTKKLNLYGDVLRFLIIKADKLPELKQREIPVKVERSERRFDRSRGSSQSGVRRPFAPRVDTRIPAVKAPEAKAPEVKADVAPVPQATEAEVKAKGESIDQKLDELLNI
jgi:ribosomal protein S6